MVRPVSVAPLFGHSTPQWLLLLSRISPTARLYTEMLVADHVSRKTEVVASYANALDANVRRRSVVQLGGADPQALAAAARVCVVHGFEHLNLNVGCPSDRVRSGSFGCVLMLSRDVVVNAVRAMADAVGRPVSVKCRIGVDHEDSYEFFRDFVADVADRAACTEFIVHARKAWLSGVSPKYNRTVPPLMYDRVVRLKSEMPALDVTLNGGLRSADDMLPLLDKVDGFMVGRAIESNVWNLRLLDERLGLPVPSTTRDDVFNEYVSLVDREWPHPHPYFAPWATAAATQSLFTGEPFGRLYRRAMGEARQKDARLSAAQVLRAAYDVMIAARLQEAEAANPCITECK